MKRVSLFILLLAFASLATISCSYADSSPPGVELSIENDYELPGNIDLPKTNLAGVAGIQTEGRIAVYDCDLKIWPDIDEDSNYNISNTTVKYVNDTQINRAIMFGESLNTKGRLNIKGSISNQYRLSVDENEVLSILGK